MPDDMDPNYAAEYPHQPYNGNPHMHPGELTLIRIIGQGRWQHPFHEHAQPRAHSGARRQPASSAAGSRNTLAGTAAVHHHDTTPGQAIDGIFYFTGRGLNWDMYGHNPGIEPTRIATAALHRRTPTATTPARRRARSTISSGARITTSRCEAAPFGDVAGGGPATLPNPNIFTNGAWYSGSPYLGPDATLRAVGRRPREPNGQHRDRPAFRALQPSNIQANPASERGWAYMWHSHNEREITTNNVFPGGMLMMMLVDSREFVIDESK